MNPALAAIVLVTVTAAQPDLQGSWQGAGPRYLGLRLVFCEDILAARVGTDPILETEQSRVSIDPAQSTIDIASDDGLRLGRYSIVGDTLTLVVSDVNSPRPESMTPRLPRPPTSNKQDRILPTWQKYVFRRANP